jgi:asparagine synthase (glutamine-hydrolysing)
MSLLSPRLREQFSGRDSWEAVEPIWRRYQAKRPGPAGLDWMTYLDLNFRLPELLLMRVDKMSMGVSLEGRVPFLDHRFVEYAMRIPEAVKTRGGVLKYILKKSVRGLIPDAVIDRPKQGFGLPLHEWLLSGLGDLARDEIETFMAGTDILDPGAVRAMMAQGGNVNVWNLLNLALWWKTYIR